MNQLATIPELQKRIALYDDMKAYRELCEFFYHRLHRTAYAFIKSKEPAEEIVSDVFIKVWQMRAKANGDRKPKCLPVYSYQKSLS